MLPRFALCAFTVLCLACGESSSSDDASGGAAGASPTGGSGGSTGGAAPTGGSGGSTGGAAGASPTGGSGGSTGGAAPTGGSGGTGGAPPVVCDATCHFVRAGATGSGDGSDWTNAWTELPTTLERGHRYYIADGSYPGYVFDDAVSGTDLITIRKATADDHGIDTGWDAGFGSGQAQLGPLEFSDPYYVLDGVVPAGFEIVGDFQGDVVSIGADSVTLRNADLNGNFAQDGGGQHVQGACTGLSVGGSNVTVEATEIHDVADDGVSVSGATGVVFRGNVIHALHACGTDGGCGPCYNGHSDGFEIYNVKQSTFDANLVYDVNSTSTFFFGNWADSLGGGPSEYCEDILLTNNLLYAPEVGLVAYIQDVVGVRVYHNVFWGLRQGGYGGLSIGLHVTDLWLYDNIILSINLNHVGATFDPAQHHGDYNLMGVSLGQWTDGAHDIVAADPGFVGISGVDGPAVTDPTPADFALTAASPGLGLAYTGSAVTGLPTTDFFGAARGATPDLGAIERP
jgi:hypothetical protein